MYDGYVFVPFGSIWQVVSLLFCPDHAEQLKRREVGVALASSFEELLGYDVLAWRSLSSGGRHEKSQLRVAAIQEMT